MRVYGTKELKGVLHLGHLGQGVFFFLWPLFARAPCHWFLEFLFAVVPGRAKCFFFCCAQLGAETCRQGQSKKQKPLRVFFVFAPAPPIGRGRSRAVGRRRPCPDAHSLTVGWGDPFGKARVVFYFLLRPRRTRRANNKKCLVYYIGSKRPGGATAKKNTTSGPLRFVKPINPTPPQP